MTHQLLEPNSPRVSYDIRRDLVEMELMCKASLSDGPWGVDLNHGLVGSDEWWSAIKSGQIRMETFVGIVRMVDGGMMGDTLEVHIEGEKGKQQWVAWRGFDPTLNGKKICTRYVSMSPKRSSTFRPDFLLRVLLQVELLD
jgi:hypothetical protein